MINAAFLLLLPATAFTGDCGHFSVGHCTPSPEDLLDVKIIPCEAIDPDQCILLCQRFCKLEDKCNYFSYNVESQECSLLEETDQNSYLSTCLAFAGPGSPPLTSCSGDTEDPCDRFVPLDCFYTGESVLTLSDVTTPTECQELLADFGDIYGATMFIHDASQNNLCDLRAADRKACSALAGPKTPEYSTCITETSFSSIPK